MSNLTHGPWVIDGSATSLDIFSSDAAVLVAVVRRSLLSSHLDQTARANARLIATAPELLEALETLCITIMANQNGRLPAQLSPRLQEREMNDRELFEYAAKAAGFVIDKHPRNDSSWARVYRSGDSPNVVGQRLLFKWDPRNDDGDALRLAVTLGIWVTPSHDQMTVTSYSIHNQRNFTERSGVDRYGATRQVILRAAGVIGKLMELNHEV